MAGRLLLDTSAAIALLADDPQVKATISSAAECFLSAVAIGELSFGAMRSSKVQENLAQIDALCASLAVLACDRVTALEYGRIKTALRAKGRPIPENDVWIAAICAQYGLDILSQDAHFDEVTGLTRVAW